MVDRLSEVPEHSLEWIDLYLKLGSRVKVDACLASPHATPDFQLRKYIVPLYEAVSAKRPYGRNVARWIDFLRSEVRPDMRSAIDIGGGAGYHLVALANASEIRKLVLVEPNHGLVAVAKERAASESLEVTPVEASSHEIPSDFHGAFDIVISNMVMAFVRAPTQHLLGLKSLLAPDGFISLQDFFIPEGLRAEEHWLLREAVPMAILGAQRPMPEMLFQEILPIIGLEIVSAEKDVLPPTDLKDVQLRAWAACGAKLQKEFKLSDIPLPPLRLNHYLLKARSVEGG